MPVSCLEPLLLLLLLPPFPWCGLTLQDDGGSLFGDRVVTWQPVVLGEVVVVVVRGAGGVVYL